jgi:hypothetical protein
MHLRSVAVALLVMLHQKVALAQRPSSDISGSYVCNFAKVKARPGSEDSVIVRSGAGKEFRKIDRLHSGSAVYICDEGGDWFKISYSSPNGPCDSTRIKGLDVQKAKGCRSGWVEKRLIDVISG